MSGANSDKEIKISVIIQVINKTDTIGRTIDSVLAQSYPAYEIIIVDDASNSNLAEFIQDKYPGKVHLIQKLTSQGSAATYNVGMGAATGHYIAFIYPDEVWHKDKLMLLATILSSQPAIALLYHEVTKEEIIGKQLPEDVVIYKLPFVKLLTGNAIDASSMIIKNSSTLLRFEHGMHMAVFDLCLRVSYKYKLYFIKIPLTQILPSATAKSIKSKNLKNCKGKMLAYTRLVKLSPMFIVLLPFLYFSSIGSYLLQMLKPKSAHE